MHNFEISSSSTNNKVRDGKHSKLRPVVGATALLLATTLTAACGSSTSKAPTTAEQFKALEAEVARHSDPNNTGNKISFSTIKGTGSKTFNVNVVRFLKNNQLTFGFACPSNDTTKWAASIGSSGAIFHHECTFEARGIEDAASVLYPNSAGDVEAKVEMSNKNTPWIFVVGSGLVFREQA
jgi:hypothetical protein